MNLPDLILNYVGAYCSGPLLQLNTDPDQGS